MPWQDEMTLASLLADPLTRLVMRSDNITVAETERVFQEAGRARAEREQSAPPWWESRPRPY
jgi:hypothetical protein